MSEAEKALLRIEAVLAEFERLDAETCGQFRQVEDREIYDIACRIERRMARNQVAAE